MADSIDEQSEALNRFSGQRDGEEVILVLRRHEVTLIPPFLFVVFMAALPIIYYIAIIPRMLPAFLYHPYQEIFFLFATIYYGFLWIISFFEWSNYYLDLFLVTNKRILSVNQLGLFHRVVSELELERIQDITSFVNGPIQTLFDYGDLEIQTASEENKIKPKSIPHPVAVRRRIMELTEVLDER